MNNNTHNIIEKITGKIQSGEVAMRSHTLFVLRVLFLAILSVFVFLVSTLIVNFIFSSLHMSSTNELLGFGPRGWGAFLWFFPWGLLIVDVVSVFLLVALLRSFRFGYRMPLLYIFSAIVFGAVFFGFMLERHTPMNMMLDGGMRGQHAPLHVGGMWTRMHTPPPSGEGVCRCEVVTIEDGGHFTARDVFSGLIYRVAVQQSTSYATTTGLAVGDRVYLAGEVEGDVFTAFGLKRGGEGRRWGMD